MPGQESQFIGTIIPTDAGIRLLGDATSLVTGPWQTVRELDIRVADGGAQIDGVVALSGLPKALQSLNAECGQKIRLYAIVLLGGDIVPKNISPKKNISVKKNIRAT